MNNSHAPLDTSSSVSPSSAYIAPHKKNYQQRPNNQNDSVDSSTNAAHTKGDGNERSQNRRPDNSRQPRTNQSTGSGSSSNYKGNSSNNRSNQNENKGQQSRPAFQESNRLDLGTQSQAPSHHTPSNKFSSNNSINKFSSTNSSTGAFVSPVLPQRDPNEEVPEASSSSAPNSSYGRSQKGKRHTALRPLPAEQQAKEEFELFGEARTGIDFAIYDDIPAQSSGENCPKAIKSFLDISFGPHLSQTLTLCGYERPTPIQKYSLPIAMARRDMIACAQTGSGKTAAFLLPTIFQLFNNEIPPPPAQDSSDHHKSYRRIQAPQALILGPTRELVTQTYKEACKLTYMTTIRPVVVYGGVPIQEQIRQLAMGCHILVATPGRLQDLCSRNNISLCNITILILDEADCMLDMGFAPQIEDVITKYGMPIQERQTLMFSATFPAQIQRLAKTYLSNYVYVTIGRVGSSTSLVTQKLLPSPQREDDKRESLLQLLDGCDGLTLIFVETRRSADLLEHFLTDHDINAASIHGDRSQYEREQALSLFKSGHCPVLVATDVASRGLSIPNVEYVINYDMPSVIDDYVHRIGRTGRCGARGIATSFIGEKNRGLAMDLLDNMREAKQVIPEFLQALVDSSRSGSSGYGYGNGHYGSKGKAPRFGANQDVRYSGGSSSAANGTAPSAPSNTYTKTTGNTYGSNSNSNDDKVNVGTYGVSSTTPQKKNAAPQTKTYNANSFLPQASVSTSALHGVQAQDDAW